MKRPRILLIPALLAILGLSGCIHAKEDSNGALIVEWSLVYAIVLSILALGAAAAGWYLLRLATKEAPYRDHARRSGGRSTRRLRAWGLRIALALWAGSLISLLFAWKDFGIYRKLSSDGLTVKEPTGLNHYAWRDLKEWTEVHWTSFHLVFRKGLDEGRVGFSKNELGKHFQGRAISITREAMEANGIVSAHDALMQKLQEGLETFEMTGKTAGPSSASK